MNKKGQTLIIFVLILPVLVLLIQMIITKYDMYYDKRNMENIAKEAIYYGLNNLENENLENKINEFINENIKCSTQIKIENNIITITLKKEHSAIEKILGNNEIKVSYKGYIEENKKKVEVAYDS